jgi:NAD(P)-dependent dehydrogenase (short-subunit alcohol dehydrogenase family)
MKNVVVTGASSGIGLAIAEIFLKKGFRVFGSVRTEHDAERLKATLGEHFTPLVFDVRDNSAILKAAEFVKNTLNTEGPLHEEKGVALLVNNAGVAVTGPLQHIDNDEFIEQFNINVFGVQRVTQAFLPLMGATFNEDVPKGKIIQISSVAALISQPFVGPYCASKAALEAYNDALRRELALFGIQVVSIQPGPVKTPIWDKARANTNIYPETEYAELLKITKASIDENERQGVAVETVAQLAFDVFENRNPKPRYMISSTNFVIKLISKLPAKWVDKIMATQLKNALQGKPIKL